MTQQEIFDYLKDNLEIRLWSKDYYRPDATCYRIELWLTNPETNQPEKISETGDWTIYPQTD